MADKDKIVLAIDPGGTTGMAIRVNGELATFTCSEPEQVYSFIYLSRNSITDIIIENFVAEHISKYGLHTVRIVGGVEALAHVFVIKYHLRPPQARYPFLEEAKQLLKGTKSVIHERDALAHLLRWEYDQSVL